MEMVKTQRGRYFASLQPVILFSIHHQEQSSSSFTPNVPEQIVHTDKAAQNPTKQSRGLLYQNVNDPNINFITQYPHPLCYFKNQESGMFIPSQAVLAKYS